MSTVTEILSSAQDGKLIENLAQNFGLSTEQTKAAVEALVPALGLALQKATANPQVLEQLVAGLVHPTHQAAFLDSGAAHGEEAADLGKHLTSQLFGSEAAAGQVAQIAARNSGVRPDVLSRLLPILISVVLGGLFKNFDSKGLGGLLAKLAGAGALGTILAQLGGGASAQASPGGAAAGGKPGGMLGGLLGALLGSLLGGGAGGRAPVPVPSPGGGGAPGGGLEDILGQLIKTLNTPAPAGTPAGHTAELQDVLDKVFPSR